MRISCALLFLLICHSTTYAQNDALNFLLSLNSDSDWNLLQTTPLQFDVYHPQGMTRVGEYFYLTSVETQIRPASIEDNTSAYDRTPGEGVGHLFKFDDDGVLIDSITLGEGTMYHPGGMNFDGAYLWISVAEYRPNSHSIVYRVDPNSLRAEEVMRFDDHLGAVARNPADGSLIGQSWGSRHLYRWQQQDDRYDADQFEIVEKSGSDVDYQDCQIVNAETLACSGIGSREIDNTHFLTIGGIELVNLNSLTVQHKIRITGTAPGHEFLTRNPFWFKLSDDGRGSFYFVPEDDRASLYQYAPPLQ